ncbi:MAG TPA: hypothetical protein VI728_06760 [Syntrophales bacterium]|nr:MAG: hypothetical protein A2052_02275 [Deltaproteobacteria bacterium GWA2_54_12]HLE17968.1 hypothetical protein [Syntrophales bacterium]
MNRYHVFLSILIFLAVGCATIGSLKPGTGSGSTFEVYDRNYEEIWKAAVTVVGRSLTIVESNKDTGTIKAEARAGITTWGEVIGVFIHPASKGEQKYTIEVISLKRSRLQITGQNWEPTIIIGMKAELNL